MKELLDSLSAINSREQRAAVIDAYCEKTYGNTIVDLRNKVEQLQAMISKAKKALE